MGESGSIPWPDDAEARLSQACAIAGALAECGVLILNVSDSRACQGWTLRARESNLPEQLAAATPGTTFSADGVALLIDAHQIKWVATTAIAPMLHLTATPPPDQRA